MPPLGEGGSRRNITMTFGVEKLEWCGYPMVIKFHRMYERDRHTDRHRMTAKAALAWHRVAKK